MRWTPNCARIMIPGRPAQTRIAVAQRGFAFLNCCETAPISPPAKIAKSASTSMAFVASQRPDRRFVTKKVAALTTALQAAAFQLQGGTSVRTGLLSICVRACHRSSGGVGEGLLISNSSDARYIWKYSNRAPRRASTVAGIDLRLLHVAQTGVASERSDVAARTLMCA